MKMNKTAQWGFYLKYITSIFGTFYKLLLLLVVVGVLFFFISPFFGIFDTWQHNYQSINTQAEFDKDYEVSKETNQQIFTQFYNVDESVYNAMSKEEKFDYAYEQSYYAQVYTLKFDVKSDTEGSLHCVNLNEFTKDGSFRDFKLDKKWSQLWSPLSITYDVQYRSNVFSRDDYYSLKDVVGRLDWETNEYGNILPFDYFERYKISYQVKESEVFGLFAGPTRQRVDFNDKIQLVLPDVDNDGIIDNRDLVLVVRIKSDVINSKESDTSYQLHEIPLRITNGVASFYGTTICS